MGSRSVPGGAGLTIADLDVRWHPSPNFGDRRGAARPSLIVIHYTAMTSAQAALTRLCLPQSEVSAHYLIAETGETIQMVDEKHRAWHAGAGAWGQVGDVNSHSIGIELANDAVSPFPEPQMAALERLLAGSMARWSIPAERVIGHSDCAPGRKIDPGRRFDWARLARMKYAVASGPLLGGDDGSAQSFQRDLQRLGYSAPASPQALLAAFRLRHRPGASGPLDHIDIQLAAALADDYPVDRGQHFA